VWAYALIAIGVLLLISNAGWLAGPTLFDLLNLWPVALLAVGVDLLTRGAYRVPVVIGAIVLALVLWFTGASGVRAGGDEVDVDHRLDGARSAEVVLRLGVGEVLVRADAPADQLLGGTVVTARGETLTQDASRDGDVARLVLATRSQGGSIVGSRGRTWDLSLTRAVPVDLRVEAGVGESRFDLRDATLSRLTMRGGVGEIDVTLPERGGYVGDIDLGVGEATIVVPRGVEARVVATAGLGAVEVEGDWQRDDRVYTTPGFAEAAPSERIEVTIDGGIGAVELERER
jgi:hypothetical protein